MMEIHCASLREIIKGNTMEIPAAAGRRNRVEIHCASLREIIKVLLREIVNTH
jgi:hypothetical protein